MADVPEFTSFDEFYPFYISQHSKPLTRIVHAIGTGLGTAIVARGLAKRRYKQALAGPIVAYGFAWFSHFVIEGNKPASFGHPLYSFRGDFTMLLDMARGRNDALQEMADDYLAMLHARDLAEESVEAFAHPVHHEPPAEATEVVVAEIEIEEIEVVAGDPVTAEAVAAVIAEAEAAKRAGS